MAEWENSKENIQPLKHGRKVNTLNTVLQVTSFLVLIVPRKVVCMERHGTYLATHFKDIFDRKCR